MSQRRPERQLQNSVVHRLEPIFCRFTVLLVSSQKTLPYINTFRVLATEQKLSEGQNGSDCDPSL